ncbi:hypothetical protein [Paraburkholderia sp. MM5477-R1]|uniref:hypothetical protein n=1 Tax=Paraburkholderia sp. MM5477-R1 TaxID=2991062 RepID=UPI003D1C30EA
MTQASGRKWPNSVRAFAVVDRARLFENAHFQLRGQRAFSLSTSHVVSTVTTRLKKPNEIRQPVFTNCGTGHAAFSRFAGAALETLDLQRCDRHTTPGIREGKRKFSVELF